VTAAQLSTAADDVTCGRSQPDPMLLSARRLAGPALWLLAVLLAGTAVAGCDYRERVCSAGEYPARSVEYPDSGRICVQDGSVPPSGYTTFPSGRTPTYADQDR
jgi:hypothetical protein